MVMTTWLVLLSNLGLKQANCQVSMARNIYIEELWYVS